jgi:hypothetical protein
MCVEKYLRCQEIGGRTGCPVCGSELLKTRRDLEADEVLKTVISYLKENELLADMKKAEEDELSRFRANYLPIKSTRSKVQIKRPKKIPGGCHD